MKNVRLHQIAQEAEDREGGLIGFLETSEHHHQGFTFNGFFDIDINHAQKLFDHFNKTGENLLNEYCECVHLSWQNKDHIYNEDMDKTNLMYSSVSKIRAMRLLDLETISYCNAVVKRYVKNHIAYLEILHQKPRKEAQKVLSNKAIRKAVFQMHGEKCLCCGTTENLTIDHVVPVSKGGPNTLSNFQPLCKPCNSRKGTQVIDYR